MNKPTVIEKEEKYSVYDFIYLLEKNNRGNTGDGLVEKKYTQGQIAQIVAKAMINFFDDSNTPY